MISSSTSLYYPSPRSHTHMHTGFDPKVLRRMGTKEEIALRAQKVVDQLADRTDPIEVDAVEEMIHTITNNIITKKQRTK